MSVATEAVPPASGPSAPTAVQSSPKSQAGAAIGGLPTPVPLSFVITTANLKKRNSSNTGWVTRHIALTSRGEIVQLPDNTPENPPCEQTLSDPATRLLLAMFSQSPRGRHHSVVKVIDKARTPEFAVSAPTRELRLRAPSIADKDRWLKAFRSCLAVLNAAATAAAAAAAPASVPASKSNGGRRAKPSARASISDGGKRRSGGAGDGDGDGAGAGAGADSAASGAGAGGTGSSAGAGAGAGPGTGGGKSLPIDSVRVNNVRFDFEVDTTHTGASDGEPTPQQQSQPQPLSHREPMVNSSSGRDEPPPQPASDAEAIAARLQGKKVFVPWRAAGALLHSVPRTAVVRLKFAVVFTTIFAVAATVAVVGAAMAREAAEGAWTSYVTGPSEPALSSAAVTTDTAAATDALGGYADADALKAAATAAGVATEPATAQALSRLSAATATLSRARGPHALVPAAETEALASEVTNLKDALRQLRQRQSAALARDPATDVNAVKLPLSVEASFARHGLSRGALARDGTPLARALESLLLTARERLREARLLARPAVLLTDLSSDELEAHEKAAARLAERHTQLVSARAVAEDAAGVSDDEFSSEGVGALVLAKVPWLPALPGKPAADAGLSSNTDASGAAMTAAGTRIGALTAYLEQQAELLAAETEAYYEVTPAARALGRQHPRSALSAAEYAHAWDELLGSEATVRTAVVRAQTAAADTATALARRGWWRARAGEGMVVGVVAAVTVTVAWPVLAYKAAVVPTVATSGGWQAAAAAVVLALAAAIVAWARSLAVPLLGLAITVGTLGAAVAVCGDDIDHVFDVEGMQMLAVSLSSAAADGDAAEANEEAEAEPEAAPVPVSVAALAGKGSKKDSRGTTPKAGGGAAAFASSAASKSTSASASVDVEEDEPASPADSTASRTPPTRPARPSPAATTTTTTTTTDATTTAAAGAVAPAPGAGGLRVYTVTDRQLALIAVLERSFPRLLELSDYHYNADAWKTLGVFEDVRVQECVSPPREIEETGNSALMCRGYRTLPVTPDKMMALLWQTVTKPEYDMMTESVKTLEHLNHHCKVERQVYRGFGVCNPRYITIVAGWQRVVFDNDGAEYSSPYYGAAGATGTEQGAPLDTANSWTYRGVRLLGLYDRSGPAPRNAPPPAHLPALAGTALPRVNADGLEYTRDGYAMLAMSIEGYRCPSGDAPLSKDLIEAKLKVGGFFIRGVKLPKDRKKGGLFAEGAPAPASAGAAAEHIYGCEVVGLGAVDLGGKMPQWLRGQIARKQPLLLSSGLKLLQKKDKKSGKMFVESLDDKFLYE